MNPPARVPSSLSLHVLNCHSPCRFPTSTFSRQLRSSPRSCVAPFLHCCASPLVHTQASTFHLCSFPVQSHPTVRVFALAITGLLCDAQALTTSSIGPDRPGVVIAERR